MHYNCIIDSHRIKKLLETKEIYMLVQKDKEKDLIILSIQWFVIFFHSRNLFQMITMF